jgi:hypothetical protein
VAGTLLERSRGEARRAATSQRRDAGEQVDAITKHTHRIELNLRDVDRLFNSMDPSPFNERDLDHDAEEFIVSWAQEYPIDDAIELRVHLEHWPAQDPSEVIRAGVHHYFAYRARLDQLEFRRLMHQGRTSLVIGLAFLTACLSISQSLQGYQAQTWAALIRESLMIAGWVAMWRPMQLYLYDWWPARRRWRIIDKLSRMDVIVTRSGAQ